MVQFSGAPCRCADETMLAAVARSLVVNVALLLFEERDKAVDFLGRTVPDLDLVLRPAAAHLHWTPVHAQTTNHTRELVIGVVCIHHRHQNHQSQPSLAIPSWVGAMRSSQRAVTTCGWGGKAGMVCVWCR